MSKQSMKLCCSKRYNGDDVVMPEVNEKVTNLCRLDPRLTLVTQPSGGVHTGPGDSLSLHHGRRVLIDQRDISLIRFGIQ